MELVIEIAGWVAAGVLLCAYAMLSRGRLSGQGSSFQSCNVVGSLLVGVNSLVHEAWPSVSVNVVWLVIGIVTLVSARHTRKKHACASATDDTVAGPIAPERAATLPAESSNHTDVSGTDVGSFVGNADWRTAHPTLV